MTFSERLHNAFEEMMEYRKSVGYATATYYCPDCKKYIWVDEER